MSCVSHYEYTTTPSFDVGGSSNGTIYYQLDMEFYFSNGKSEKVKDRISSDKINEYIDYVIAEMNKEHADCTPQKEVVPITDEQLYSYNSQYTPLQNEVNNIVSKINSGETDSNVVLNEAKKNIDIIKDYKIDNNISVVSPVQNRSVLTKDVDIIDNTQSDYTIDIFNPSKSNTANRFYSHVTAWDDGYSYQVYANGTLEVDLSGGVGNDLTHNWNTANSLARGYIAMGSKSLITLPTITVPPIDTRKITDCCLLVLCKPDEYKLG